MRCWHQLDTEQLVLLHQCFLQEKEWIKLTSCKIFEAKMFFRYLANDRKHSALLFSINPMVSYFIVFYILRLMHFKAIRIRYNIKTVGSRNATIN